METWHERIRARRKELDMSQVELARACKVEPPSVNGWETGKTKSLKGKSLILAAKALGVTPEWILTGQATKQEQEFVTVRAPRGDPESDDVMVKFLPSKTASAGYGSSNGPEDSSLGLRFSGRSLRKQGIDPDDALIIFARGDSMEPDIRDGDTIMFDRSRLSIRDGKKYVIEVEGEELVKVLHKRPGGVVFVQSLNPAYPAYEVRPDQGGFRILGEVVWTAGWA